MSLERITHAARMGVIMGAATGYVAAMYGAGLIATGVGAYRLAVNRLGSVFARIDESARHPANAFFGNIPPREYKSVYTSAQASSDFGHNLPDSTSLPSEQEVLAGIEALLRENERRYH